MPRRRSPPRLYFDQTRQQWAVRDGSAFVRTGCGKDDRDALTVCHYDGRAIHDPRTIWRKVVKAAGLELHGPDKVTLHTLRHTRATWMMQRGVPIWEAAGFLGMTVKTLESVYGHHSPDHQEQAANV